MTKSIATGISILLFLNLTFAETPPTEVQKAFEQKFAKATNIKWAKENSKEWEAEFILNGTNVSANFSNNGTWVETETEISVSELPSKVYVTIMMQNSNCKISSAYKIESATKPTKYEADIKTGKKKKEVILYEDGTTAK